MTFIDKKYLPSNRFMISVGIAVFIVIIAVAITYITPAKKTDEVAYQNSTTSFSGNYAIPDWKTVTSSTTVPAIDKLSRSLFANIALETQGGNNIDATKASTIADNAIKNIPQRTIPDIYTYSDLNLIPVNRTTLDSDIAKFKKVYLTQTTEFKKIAGSDLSIINDIFANKPADNKTLKEIVTKYKSIITALKSAPLPAEKKSLLSALILEIINSIGKIVFIDNDIINSGKNSINAYSDIINYYQALHGVLTLLNTADYVFNIDR